MKTTAHHGMTRDVTIKEDANQVYNYSESTSTVCKYINARDLRVKASCMSKSECGIFLLCFIWARSGLRIVPLYFVIGMFRVKNMNGRRVGRSPCFVKVKNGEHEEENGSSQGNVFDGDFGGEVATS